MGIYDTDPFDTDPFSSRSRGRRQPQLEYNTPATPEETESMASTLFRMTGMPYVAAAFDKPGRAARGLFGGNLRELGNLVPFSDSIGLTDPKQEVTGSQLNKKYLGLEDDNSWKSWGAGLATELVTDPLTYINPMNIFMPGAKGALTAAGKAAHAQGVLKGMTREQMLRGFTHTEDALRAAGKTADEIAHIGRQKGNMVATRPASLRA